MRASNGVVMFGKRPAFYSGSIALPDDFALDFADFTLGSLTHTPTAVENFGATDNTWTNSADYDTSGPSPTIAVDANSSNGPNTAWKGTDSNTDFVAVNTNIAASLNQSIAVRCNLHMRTGVVSRMRMRLRCQSDTASLTNDCYMLRIIGTVSSPRSARDFRILKVSGGTVYGLGAGHGGSPDIANASFNPITNATEWPSGAKFSAFVQFRFSAVNDAQGRVHLLAESWDGSAWKVAAYAVDDGNIAGAVLGAGRYGWDLSGYLDSYANAAVFDTVTYNAVTGVPTPPIELRLTHNTATTEAVGGVLARTNDGSFQTGLTSGATLTTTKRYLALEHAKRVNADVRWTARFGSSTANANALTHCGILRCDGDTPPTYYAALITCAANGSTVDATISRVVDSVFTTLVSETGLTPPLGAGTIKSATRYRFVATGSGATVTLTLYGWDGADWVTLATYGDTNAARIVAAGQAGAEAMLRNTNIQTTVVTEFEVLNV